MSVHDDELLALAGDSSDEGDMPSTTIRNANSPLPSIEVSHASRSKDRKQSGGSSQNRSSYHRASEEEGEASARDYESASMSESESDGAAASPPSEENPYPIENQYKSEQDRRYILALPEVEREVILAARGDELEKLRISANLRTLKQRKDRESKGLKRKASATDADDSPRKSSRQKTTLGGRKVGEASKSIQEYKKQREEGGLKVQQRKANALARREQRGRSSSDLRASSADADGESEVEWDDGGRSKADEERFRTAQPGDYDDFRRVTLNRFFLAEFCFHPGFEERVKDCYVRILKKTAPGSEGEYQLVQIKSVFEKQDWPYAMIRRDGSKKIVTSQHLMLAVEGTQKEFHMNSVSNSRLTEVEVANHKEGLVNEGKRVPTRSFLSSKIDDINSVINYKFTEAELQHKLERAGIHQKRAMRIQRTALQNQRRLAEEHGDEDAVAKCDVELATLNGPKLKYGTFLEEPKSLAPVAPPKQSEQDRLADLNRINRQKNREEIRKAQIAEKKQARLAREAAMRGEAVEDPMARLKTRIQTHFDVNAPKNGSRAHSQNVSRNVSRGATPSGLGTPKLEPKKMAGTASPQPKPRMQNGLPILGASHREEDIIGNMDLNIEIEI